MVANKIARCTLVASILLLFVGSALAIPTVNVPGYTIEQFVTGAGAVDGMGFSPSGDLFFTDYAGGRVLRVAAPFVSGVNPFSVYATGIPGATDLTFDSGGRLFASSGPGYEIVEVFSNGTTAVYSSGHDFPTSVASFGSSLFVSNSGDGTISEIDSVGNKTTLLSGFSTPHGPYGISFSPSGSLYFLDHATSRIYESDSSGSAPQLLGSFSQSLAATFTGFSPTGELFVANFQEGALYRMISPGNLSLFASGFEGSSNAPFIGPTGMAFDGTGNLYVGDASSIWKISAVAVVPEPTSVALLAVGCAVLLVRNCYVNRSQLY